jgi:2'-5' RNA ligase
VTDSQHRVYFALWPDATRRAAIATAVAPTLAAIGGRSVMADDLHVTLAFLGGVASSALATLARIGATLAAPAVTIKFDQPQWWSGSRAFVVAASSPPAALMELQDGLRRSIAAAGLSVDAREYRPHLTLARGVPARPLPTPSLSLDWPVGAVALVESVGGTVGARYRPLALWENPASSVEFHEF